MRFTDRNDIFGGGRRYTVREDRRDHPPLGYVESVDMPSHVRRGRMQANPWWKASCLAGHVVTQDPALDRVRVRPASPGRFVTRERAGQALLEHLLGCGR